MLCPQTLRKGRTLSRSDASKRSGENRRQMEREQVERHLEDPSLLKLRSLDSCGQSFLSDNSTWGQ